MHCGNPEERPEAIQEEHQHHQHAGGRQPQPRHAKAMHHHNHQQCRAQGGRNGHRQRPRRRHGRPVHHKPRQQQRKQRHHSAQHRMPGQQAAMQPLLPAAEKIIAGQNRDGRNGRQNVARQLGLREREKHNRNQRPQHQKLRKRIARPVRLRLVRMRAPQPPLRHRGLYAVNQRADRQHCPRHQRQQHHHQVVPNRLLMLIPVGREPLQVVLQKELPEERRVLHLHRDKPRQHDGEVQNHARPPERALQQRPLPPQRREGRHNHNRKKRRHRPLGQRGYAGKKVNVEEPKLGVRLVPRVPAQQPY